MARLLAIILAAPSGAPCLAVSCANLAQLSLPDTSITSATIVSADSPTPTYCRVTATLKPTSDSDIKIEVWLPETHWNGKYLAVGNGGWSGAINTRGMLDGVRRVAL